MVTLFITNNFIWNLYADFPDTSKSLQIPSQLDPYSENFRKLSSTSAQLLETIRRVMKNKRVSHQHLYEPCYDEDDPYLMIEEVNKTFYRRTLGVCFEMFFRRQLTILYNAQERDENGHNMIKNVKILLPVLNALPSSLSSQSNADDIRALPITIPSYDITKPVYHRLKKYQCLWYTKEKSLLKFRCRPALLNSMDCMVLLEDNSTCASKEILTKIAYFLRPFRFVLPLSFLFDIFGGHGEEPAIELQFPSHINEYHFPDANVLMDVTERKWTKINKPIEKEKMLTSRLAKACLAGGSVSYILDTTNDFNDLDLFIKYNYRLFSYISEMKFIDNQSQIINEKIWIINKTYDYDNSNSYNSSDSKSSKLDAKIRKIPQNNNLRKQYPLLDPKIIFQNKKFMMVKLHSIFTLNPNLCIFQHWMKKYGKHSPQIIFYECRLELDEYVIFKMISGFDLPICRGAISFHDKTAFHLREHILRKIFGIGEIDAIPQVQAFINKWENDEINETNRKYLEILNFETNIPEIKEQNKYITRYIELFENDDSKNKYVKQRRQIKIIKWLFDFIPYPQTGNAVDKTRYQKYLERMLNKLVDFEGQETLPMEVFPLKYLAYMKLMQSSDNFHTTVFVIFMILTIFDQRRK